jgi:hypothetical protein
LLASDIAAESHPPQHRNDAERAERDTYDSPPPTRGGWRRSGDARDARGVRLHAGAAHRRGAGRRRARVESRDPRRGARRSHAAAATMYAMARGQEDRDEADQDHAYATLAVVPRRDLRHDEARAAIQAIKVRTPNTVWIFHTSPRLNHPCQAAA